jgi:cytidylate kinase
VHFLETHYGVSRSQAAGIVDRSCRRRAIFLNNLDPRDPNDPEIYHLCINTGLMELQEAEEMVLDMVQMQSN